MKKILLITVFAGLIYSQCDTYYADIDGDGDGAKSVWCSYTDLPHATGGNWEDAGWETNGCGTVGWNGSTAAGHLTYGPYISTDPGLTFVTWNMLANGDTNNDGTQIATIDIFDATSNELLAWQDINVNDFNGSMAWQDFTLSYYSSPDHVYEFRTWYAGAGGHLVLRYITHVNEDADAQGAYETTTLCDGDDTSGWSLNDDDLMPLCAENSNDDCWDCASEWGGSAVEDECGICSGDGSSCLAFQPQTKEELETAVNLWVDDNETALSTYGDINSWDVSIIADMNSLFSYKTTFNDDISNWDVSNVESMSHMFLHAESFDQDISNWDVSSVTNMQGMFRGTSYSGDLSTWDVSSVTEMHNMFGWFTGTVDISSWDVSSVTNMHRMFCESNFNGDISGWTTSSLTNTSEMFSGNTDFNGDINGWDVSNVTTMIHMFLGATSFNQDLNSWDVSNGPDMYSLFSGASSFNGDVSDWDVSNVTSFGSMFQYTSFNGDLSNWDVSNAIHFTSMFSGVTSFNGDISGWDVSSATSIHTMFSGATSFNQDISGWDVSNVGYIGDMFSGATSFNQDLSSWDVSNVIHMNNVFHNTIALSDANRCLINSTWSSNNLWPYDWSSLCSVAGCTNSEACNYDVNATDDDGSCEYSEDNYDCDGNCLVEIDCAGECGGSAEYDECDECDGLGPVPGYDCEGNDIDECALEIDTCHDNASCYNQGGGYTCICNDGYAGNGQDEDGGCSDINECEATNYGFCVEDAVCINTEGSHYCECFDGYDGDGSSLGTGCTSLCNPDGDANGDTVITVTDLVLIINNILNDTISDELICSSDINGDGAVNVVDIVAIVESIIN